MSSPTPLATQAGSSPQAGPSSNPGNAATARENPFLSEVFLSGNQDGSLKMPDDEMEPYYKLLQALLPKDTGFKPMVYPVARQKSFGKLYRDNQDAFRKIVPLASWVWKQYNDRENSLLQQNQLLAQAFWITLCSHFGDSFYVDPKIMPTGESPDMILASSNLAIPITVVNAVVNFHPMIRDFHDTSRFPHVKDVHVGRQSVYHVYITPYVGRSGIVWQLEFAKKKENPPPLYTPSSSGSVGNPAHVQNEPDRNSSAPAQQAGNTQDSATNQQRATSPMRIIPSSQQTSHSSDANTTPQASTANDVNESSSNPNGDATNSGGNAANAKNATTEDETTGSTSLRQQVRDFWSSRRLSLRR